MARCRLNYIRVKRADTWLAWINSIFLVMNLMVLLKCFFACYKQGLLAVLTGLWRFDQVALINVTKNSGQPLDDDRVGGYGLLYE